MTLEQAKEIAIKDANDCLIGKAMVVKSYDNENEYTVVIGDDCFAYQKRNRPNEIMFMVDGGWFFEERSNGAGYNRKLATC